MKYKAFFLLITLFLVISCSESDDNLEKLSDAPTGEIINITLRDFILTGNNATASKQSESTISQKWWNHKVSSFNYSNSKCGQNYKVNNTGHFAFTHNGEILVKLYKNSESKIGGYWKWTSNNKEAISITHLGREEKVFTITYLNDNNIVYSSSNQEEEDCYVSIYEQFNNPYFK